MPATMVNNPTILLIMSDKPFEAVSIESPGLYPPIPVMVPPKLPSEEGVFVA